MSLCNPSKGVATSPKTLLRDVQRGPWENTKMGTLEMFPEIIKPQQSDRVEVAPWGHHQDSQRTHSHCLKHCIMPRIYLENAECLLC